MRKGLILVAEKSRAKGKKVFQVVFDRNKNDIFQTFNAKGIQNGYYPASQEYGYFAKNGRFIPGYHFMSNAITRNANNLEIWVTEELLKELKKVKL